MAFYGQTKLRLGEILVGDGIITEETLQEALSKKGTMKIGEYLVENNIVSEDQIANALSSKLGYLMINLRDTEIPQDILNLVELKNLKKNKVIPVAYSEGNMNILRLAMADPTDINAIDDISIITGCQIEPLVSTPRDVMLALDRYYGSDEMNSKLEEYAKEKFSREEEDEFEDDINGSPIVMLVKEMIDKAARQRASDIHIEALERDVRVRYRIDGVLYERARYNIKVLPAIVARVKIISGMDISEKRKPQDGRITQVVDRVEYDIRVSAL
ncbi:MAG: Flp pilus assembly complex ATPase component TadA, partial [Lachnospiraceae bacterium]|nr:Flp pilus assembly complex ATPase component TadA [Lachnospiraceae bacterium]